jgi:hypothetical protein
MIDLRMIRKELKRLSGLNFPPTEQEGWMELANVLQRRCTTMEQVQKVLDRWIETEENVPKPAQLGSLCGELAAGAAILPEGCDECGRDGLWRDVQRLDQDGQIVYCLARCTCARGRQLAALDSQRAIEQASRNRKQPTAIRPPRLEEIG